MKKFIVIAMVSVLCLAMVLSATRGYGDVPPKLYDYDWAKWLIGEWEGTYESPQGIGEIRQTFEFAIDAHYIFTTITSKFGEDEYEGMGVFVYYPEQDSAYGNWFDAVQGMNDGHATRKGNKMIWKIERLGRKITRIREKISEDKYIVTNEIIMPDGKIVHSKEVMKRRAEL